MFKQITVFLENKPGRMEDVTGCLANANINIHALSIADTTDFGILRMIVSHPDEAVGLLKENDFMAKTTDVIAVAIGYEPGSLHKVLRQLSAFDISVEYMYAFTSRHADYDAVVILSLRDQETVLDKLKNTSIPLLGDDFLAQLNQA